MFDVLEIEGSIPHVHKTSATDDWRDHYDTETGKIIKFIFAKDIIF